MPKPTTGANASKTTTKTAAQLRKEEEERKRKAAEEAEKTSEQKRNELRAEQGLQPSVNVGRVSSSGATHGGGAGSFAPKEEHYDGGAAVRAEKESVYREPTKAEKQQEQGYRRRQTNRQPAKFTPTGAKLTKTAPKASDLLPGQTEHLAKEASRRAFEARISGDKKAEEIYNTTGNKMRERLYGSADNIDLLDQAATNALKKGTPLQTVYSVGGYRFTLDDLERAGYDKEAIQRVKALGDRKAREQTKERNKAFTASYIPTEEQAEHISQHYRSSLGQAVKEAEERIIHGQFANEKERAAFGAQYRNWNEQYQAMLMADADDDAIHAEINEVQARLREIDRSGRTISVVNATDANDRVEYDEAARNFYLNKLNTLQQIADYKADRYVLAQIEGKNATAKFDELFSLYNQRAGINQQIKNAYSKYADEGIAASRAADLIDNELEPVEAKIRAKEAELKKLGFSDSHFQLYSDMKNQALSQKINLAAENLVDLFPGLKGIAVAAGGLALSGVTAPIRGIARMSDLANTEGKGYQVGKILQDAVSSMTGAVVRNIEERYEGPVGKALGQLYQIAESTIDSVVNDTVMGKFAAPVMGLNACAQEYDDALARGIPQKQAAALGVMAGVFETLFEYLSLENIHKIADVTHVGKRGLAEAFLKSGVFEGLEELNTSVANYAVDYLVAGGLSKYNTAMANGYTPAQHAVETLKEIGMDALGGFISGVAIGGTAGLARQGYGQAVRYGNNIAAGRDIAKGGDVSQVIGAAKASENTRTQKLGAKLEEKAQKGKNAYTLTGRVYNRIQGENIYDAARQRAIDLAAERGETLTDRQADAIATAVRESQETLRPGEDGTLVYTLSPGAETAVQEGIGKDVLDEYTGSKKTAAWAEATRRNFAEFARDTGAYVDDVARVQRIERGIRDRMAETNKALREGNGTQLVTKAVEGTFRTEGGKKSSVTIGGIDGVTENNAIRVVVDGDGKGGVQTTAVLDLREDAPAGTVTPADEAQRELYLSLNGAVTGQLTQTVADDYGTGYRPDLTTPMSLPAANNLIAMYDPDVNRDAGAFVAWGYDAFKAGSRGMAWQAYLDMYRDGSAAVYGQYITDAQLREAFRAGQAQFEAKPGVTRIGTKDLDSQELARLAALDEVFRRQGFSVIVVDHFDDINGYVSDRADVAVVALDSEEGLFEVAAFHEIYHVLTRELGTSGGRQFVSAVLAEYRNAVGDVRFNEDLEDVAKRYGVDKAGLADEDARWKIYEEMAAQYFGVIAAKHMDGLVDGLNRTGGQRLLSKVREVLRQFVEDIRAALNRLAGRDPATAAALKTEAENAQRILDLFDEAVAQTREERTARLTEQGERIREEAVRAESGVRSAKSKMRSMKSTKGATAEELGRLADAQRRIADGESDEQVRRETGWFRGYDGKWRLEIDDSKMTLHLPNEILGSDFSRLMEIEAKLETGTTEKGEVREAMDLSEKLQNAIPRKIGDIVSHPDLFKAYPSINDIRIEFSSTMGRTIGAYDETNNRIALNTTLLNNADELKKTLAHEIQHAIQDIEGLSPGSSKEYWEAHRRIPTIYEQKERDKASQKIADTKQSIQDAYGEEAVKAIQRAWKLSLLLYDADGSKFFEHKKEYESLRKTLQEKGWQDAFYDYVNAQNALQALLNKHERRKDISPFENYKATAGEIEARDVENRVDLTAEERKNTRPDIDRTDVVFADRRTESRRTDADYMAVVERGDMDAAQKMVDEAAKAAGYDVEAYHGSANSFSVFDRNKIGKNYTYSGDSAYGGFFFTNQKQSADYYAKGGKTYHVLLRFQNPYVAQAGDVFYNGADMWDFRSEEFSRMLYAYVDEDWNETIKSEYDGIIIHHANGDLYVARDPSQIKLADPVTYDDNGNVIPLSERFNAEKEDIRWSKRTQTAREEMDAAVVGGEMLGQMLDAARDVLHKAHTEIDKAAFDAWLQGKKTGGKVAARRGIMGVVKKYNDPQLTGMSHEQLADRIVQGFMDLKDYDFGADELVYTVIDAMAAKAAGQSETIENETREIIRGVTEGQKYVVSDKDLGEITGTLGLTKGQLNRTLKQVYGFTLAPASRTEAADGLEYLDVAMDQVAEALPNLFEGSSLFENSTADNGNAVNRVVWLYENRDQMEMEERTQGDELGLYKYDPDSDEALEATMTLYERAYQEAANFAEDLIRLSPVHTVADAYDGTMSELKQATRGMMQRRAREIEAIREQIETAEAGLNMAAQTNAALTQEAAKKQRRIDSLTDQLAVAERDARRARDAGDEKAAALEEKVGGLKDQIAELKKQVKAERDKVTRRDVALLDARADRDARLKAQREYYAQKRHEGVLQRQDTALKQRLRKQIVSNVLWLNGRFTRPSDQQHIPEELKHVIAPFIEAFAQNEKTAGWYAFKRNQIDDLLMFYERLNADDARNEGTEAEKSLLYGKYDEDVADMLRALKTTIDGKKITELASAELSMIDSIIANLRKMVADANTVFLEGRNVNFSQSAGRFIAETQAKAKTRSPLLEKIRKGADGININMAKPIYLFKEIVGGEISKYFDEIREAQNRWAFMVRDSARAVQAIQEKYHYKDWKKDGISFTFSDGYTAVLTKDAVLQIYATYKREIGQIVPSNHLTQGGVVFSQELDEQQTARALRKALKNDGKNGTKEFDRLMQANREKIASKAHHLTTEDILRLGRTLTPEQMQYADAVVRYLSDTVSEWGNRTSMELYGYKKFLERYYFPFQSSDLYLHQSIGVTNDARIKNKGFTKMLQKGANNPIVITGFSEVAAKHIGEMASYSALTAPLENMNRLLQYSEKPVMDGDETVKEGRSVKDALMAAYGGDVYKYMHTFLTQMNGGVKQDATAGLINRMTGRFRRAAVALNFSVMVQQPSAVARAMAMVDPKYFVRSTAHWFDYKELEKWSGVAVIKSFGGFDTDVGRSTTSYILGESTAAEKIGEVTGWGAEKMDAITWSHIWNAVKRETAHEMGITYRRKGMSEEFYRRAAARFNEVADYTQVYDSTISRSQWMRSQDNGVKMMTAFMAEPTTTYNMLLFSGMKKNGKAINKGAAIGAFVANVILNTALQSLIGAWRDKEDESYWERYFRKLVQGIFGTRENLFTDSEFNILNMVPYIKDIISLFQGYDVERSDMSAVSELLKALEKIRKAYDGREDDQALWDFIKENSELLLSTGVTLSNFTGLPLKSMYRDIWQGGKNAIEHLREGDYHTTARHLVNIWKQTFEGEWDKNEQLYYAVMQGDKELLDRMVKVTEEDYEKYINSANNAFDAQAHAAALKEKALHTQIAEALVEMDGRIADAAKAVYTGDVSRATALADAVAKDGFDLSDVNHAIQMMGKQLYPNDKEYSDNITQYALVTNDMLDHAYGDGNKQAVVELRDALIEQGKSADTVNQRIGNMIDEDFATGEIGLQEAKAAYDAMTTFTDEKKQQRLTKQAGKLYENDGSMSYDALRDVYLQIGVTEENVGKQMADVIVNDYVDGKFDGKAAAVAAYMKQTGETDEQSATLKFDYEDAKARDENYPLTFSNYKKYVESGLKETGVSVAAYDQFLTATKNITSSTTSAGWEAYSARMASVKSYNKFTTKQYHYVQAIEETFDTVEQKDAAYRATAAAENWSLAKLPLTPWH